MLELDIVPEAWKRQSLEVGQVLRMEMDEGDGITPKPGKTSKLKRFVIIGSFQDAVVAALVINSDINDHFLEKKGAFQHHIFKRDYAFLDHNSFVDGFLLREFSVARVLETAQYLGRLGDQDVANSIQCVLDSPMVKPYLISKYKLKKG